LQLLRAEHAGAIREFELANRSFFAASISDRGDAFFDRFEESFGQLLAEQAAGQGAYYLLLDDGAAVLGRFNLYLGRPGIADLGYRVGEPVTGRGVATAGVGQLCRLAVADHGLRRLRAAVSHANRASQRVLLKSGFELVGPAEPGDLGGKAGDWYERELTGRPQPG